LLIGVGDYVKLDDLQYTAQDVEQLAQQLESCGFPKRQIVVLKDGASSIKYQPMKTNIEKQLELVLNLVGPEDVLLIAFSGHGMQAEGVSYLCPAEADVGDPAGTMLAVDTIYKQLEDCRAAMKLVIVDACRNDPRPAGRKSATAKEDGRKLAMALEQTPQGIRYLASCGPGQISWEDADLQHGVFMYYLLEGLRGKADTSRNGMVSLGELYDYVSGNVKLHVYEKWSELQIPYDKGEMTGNFEFPLARGRPSGDRPPVDPIPQREASQEVTNRLGMRLVRIPAGEFVMGRSEKDESLAAKFGFMFAGLPSDAQEVLLSERPAHPVRITRPFYMGKYEVTVEQFGKFVEATGYKTDAEKFGGSYVFDEQGWAKLDPKASWRNPGFEQGPDHPVVCVSWNDGVAFCKWLRAYPKTPAAE